MEEVQIVFVGLAGSGKTTLLNRLVLGEFRAVPPTMGFSADVFDYADSILIRAIDLGGQDPFIHTFWKQFIPTADVIVFLVDASDHKLFNKVKDTLRTVFSWIKTKNPIFMVLANKQDLPTALGFEDIIYVMELLELAQLPISALQFFSCSAKDGQGVNTAFDWLVSRLSGRDEIPSANVYQTYLYDYSGNPICSSNIRSFASEINGIETGANPELATAFYSALSLFVEEIISKIDKPHSSKINDMILTNPYPYSPDLKFNHFKDDESKTLCVVISEDNDSSTANRAVAESAFAITRSFLKYHPDRLMPEELLTQHILPFVKNPPEKLKDIEKPEISLSIESISGEDQVEYKTFDSYQSLWNQSYAPTFFTKLAVMERVMEFEKNST